MTEAALAIASESPGCPMSFGNVACQSLQTQMLQTFAKHVSLSFLEKTYFANQPRFDCPSASPRHQALLCCRLLASLSSLVIICIALGFPFFIPLCQDVDERWKARAKKRNHSCRLMALSNIFHSPKPNSSCKSAYLFFHSALDISLPSLIFSANFFAIAPVIADIRPEWAYTDFLCPQKKGIHS